MRARGWSPEEQDSSLGGEEDGEFRDVSPRNQLSGQRVNVRFDRFTSSELHPILFGAKMWWDFDQEQARVDAWHLARWPKKPLCHFHHVIRSAQAAPARGWAPTEGDEDGADFYNENRFPNDLTVTKQALGPIYWRPKSDAHISDFTDNMATISRTEQPSDCNDLPQDSWAAPGREVGSCAQLCFKTFWSVIVQALLRVASSFAQLHSVQPNPNVILGCPFQGTN